VGVHIELHVCNDIFMWLLGCHVLLNFTSNFLLKNFHHHKQVYLFETVHTTHF
jgi:hypothetical protein